jgi:transcription antitermination factor NusG
MHQTLQSHISQQSVKPGFRHAAPCDGPAARNWYAVYTHTRHEKACEKQLAQRGVEVFLPTYSQERTWKNRQHVNIRLPLFTSYLFVRIADRERSKVLGAPRVLRVLGNAHGPEPVPEAAIELLRGTQFRDRIVPSSEMDVGQKVRIHSGALQGLQGVLVRKKNKLWFVLSIELINQRAMVEVQAHEIEAVPA